MLQYSSMPPENPLRIRPQDVLNEREFELYERARRGEIPCPRCDLPLLGLFFFEVLPDGEQSKGVTLRCPGCQYEES